MDDSGPVLMFDGECGLCERCVRWLLVTDQRGRLRFSPLQGEAAQRFLRGRGLPTEDFDSAIFVADWAQRFDAVPLLFRTEALLAALRAAGGGWRWFAWLRLVPRTWRDVVYRRVARWRKRFFGGGNFAALVDEFGPEQFLL